MMEHIRGECRMKASDDHGVETERQNRLLLRSVKQRSWEDDGETSQGTVEIYMCSLTLSLSAHFPSECVQSQSEPVVVCAVR